MRSCEVCSPGDAAAVGGDAVTAAAATTTAATATAAVAAAAVGIVGLGDAGVEAREVDGEGLGAENRSRVERECWGPGDGEEPRSGEVAMWEAELMAAPRERAGDCCCAGKRERCLVALRDGDDDEAIRPHSYLLFIIYCSFLPPGRVGGRFVWLQTDSRVGGQGNGRPYLNNRAARFLHESSLGYLIFCPQTQVVENTGRDYSSAGTE